MAETLYIPENADKEEIYQALLPQLKAILKTETDLVANTANVCAVLKEAFNFFWVGFYFDKNEGELVLGPFQGPLACTRIKYNRGVCGHAFTTQKAVIVPNVNEFPGHIACSSASQSEIVIPVFSRNGKILGVLDIDSDRLNQFDQIDQTYLEKIAGLLQPNA